MNTKYIAGSICAVPMLPLLYFQGKKIRKNIPDLPEAKGEEGYVLNDGKREIRLLCIGESTIAGVGVDTHEEGFAGTLAKELARKCEVAVSWKVYAKSGYTAATVSRKIIPKLVTEQPDLIVIGLGGNDAFTLNRPRRWRKQIRQLIENLRSISQETPIVFLNMPPIKDFPAFPSSVKFVLGNLVEILGEELNKVIQKEPAVYYNPEVITFKEWSKRWNMQGAIQNFFSDGVHPSEVTYQLLAKDLANFIVDTGDIIERDVVKV